MNHREQGGEVSNCWEPPTAARLERERGGGVIVSPET